MIIREWRGRTKRDMAEAYPKHFHESVMPELKTIAGFLGAELCRRTDGEKIEFLVLTRWRSMEAIGAFAGANPSKAVVEPAAVAALEDFDKSVRHYEAIEALTGD